LTIKLETDFGYPFRIAFQFFINPLNQAIKKPDRQFAYRAFSSTEAIYTLYGIDNVSDYYSTVTDFAKLRGWSTSVPRKTAT